MRALITVNVLVFFLQIIIQEPITDFLACRASDLFAGFPLLWKPLTATFAHGSPMHLLLNMFFLFIFGRQIEMIYERRDFLTLYFCAGFLSTVCEAIVQQLEGYPNVPILGASGAVMALVVLTAMFYPHQRMALLFFPFVTFPLWMFCAFVVLMDVLGALSPNTAGSGVAHFAHLGGAAFGFSYRYFDLRWTNLRRWLPFLSGRRRRPRPPRDWRVIVKEEPAPRRSMDPEEISVSLRIDELLEKISQEGLESLSEEEQRFLTENSGRYRSPS